MRYAVSGRLSTGFTDGGAGATGSATGAAGQPTALKAGQNLLGENLPTGRTFWLRNIYAFQDVSAGGPLHLLDSTAGDTDVTTSRLRMSIGTASGELTTIDFPAPGIKFATGCVVMQDTSATGVWGIGRIGGSGYYE